jgi:hypothetical protein
VAVALAVASPQIAAMVAQTRSGGASVPATPVDVDYVRSGTSLPGLFAASPQVISRGLTALNSVSYHGPTGDGVATFGLLLTALAVAGLAVSWRRRSARQLALLWLGVAALSLGSTLKIGGHVYVPAAEVWHGVRLSAVMPFTWFVQIPGMAGFREAARLTMLAFVPAALLARCSSPCLCSGHLRSAGRATRPWEPCPPRCRRSITRSLPTIPNRLSWTSRSASGGECR